MMLVPSSAVLLLLGHVSCGGPFKVPLGFRVLLSVGAAEAAGLWGCLNLGKMSTFHNGSCHNVLSERVG